MCLRRFLVGASLVASAGLLAACGNTKPASAPATTSPARAPSSTAATSTTAPSSSPTSTTKRPSSTTSTTSPASASSLPTNGGTEGCTSSELAVQLGSGQGAAGTFIFPLEFTNTSENACVLYGYPGVSGVAGSAAIEVGAPAARVTTSSPAVVTLSPGAVATATLDVIDALNFPKSTCRPTAVRALRVYAPGDSTAQVVSASHVLGCASSAVTWLRVGPVKAPGTARAG
jgi:hypothetical protein